jgi:hypothetical protein
MINPKKIITAMCVTLLIGQWMTFPGICKGQQKQPVYNRGEGVSLYLTEDFYRALRDENASGEKVYSNKASDEYLRQIAVSAKFMVETNIQILKQQETVIQLLQSISEKKDEK